ncbi:MAG: prmA 3 [Acidobacteria bacterium]|nr:prmA 3 [Acidobacteriota bacterium]
MKQYPAIDVRTDAPDLLLALVDDFGPTAVEERGDTTRIFFASTADRDTAERALAPRFEVAAVDVDDEDWARRSQENLKPITVGRITVVPGVASRFSHQVEPARDLTPMTIVIVPSMGFGTGHHATTRLCLAALQTIDLRGAVVLDVGTGSGVLAIAAARLGAARALGIDYDADAIQSARENLDLNADAAHVTFETVDLAARALPVADVLTANLTGALLVRSAATLLEAVRAGGTLILSGVQAHERDEVRAAFANAAVCWEREEDGWVGLAVKKP